jgi:small ligand-binding sensory domain FIST
MTAAAAPTPPTPPSRPLTVRAAPRREPPFDDELPPRHLHLIGRYDQPLPFLETPSGQSLDVARTFAPTPTRSGELPDAVAFGRRLLVAIMEAKSGRRTFHQLATHLSQGVYTGLVSDQTRPARQQAWRGRITIRSVRVCEPTDGVAELSAVVQVGARYRAVAARLEGRNGRWRCVRLQLG